MIHPCFTLGEHSTPAIVKTSGKTWTATRYNHLYRHKSGTYYARLRIAGKQTWQSLGTDLLSVAQHELNNTVAAVKKLFGLAVERGVRQTNPAGHLKRVKRRFFNQREDVSHPVSFHFCWFHFVFGFLDFGLAALRSRSTCFPSRYRPRKKRLGSSGKERR